MVAKNWKDREETFVLCMPGQRHKSQKVALPSYWLIASPLQIHPFCLLCENKPQPFKYVFLFVGCHDVQFCQSWAMERHCRRKWFCFPVWVCIFGSLLQHEQLSQHPFPAVHMGSSVSASFNLAPSITQSQHLLPATPPHNFVVNTHNETPPYEKLFLASYRRYFL